MALFRLRRAAVRTRTLFLALGLVGVLLASGLNAETSGVTAARPASGLAPPQAGTAPKPMDLTAAASALIPGSSRPSARLPFSLATDPTWTDMGTTLGSNQPSERYIAMMAYDPVDQYVVLFGGDGPSGILGDTWVFQNGQWADLTGSQTSAPAARCVAAMTWDAKDGYVLLFGGYNEDGTYYNDTWSFVHGSWSEITTSTAPSPRWRSVIAYDATDQYVVLFGGTPNDATGEALHDTWTYAGGNWTNITSDVAGAPPSTYRASAVWDAADGYVLMFGGCTDSTCPTQDTYSYVNDTWTDLTSSDGTAPSARVYTWMTWDNATNQVILFGGGSSDTGPGLNDTWAFAGGKWYDESANLSIAPEARGWQTMAYDPQFDSVILFGGYTGSSYFGDTWSYGPELPTVLLASPSGIEFGQTLEFDTIAFTNNPPLSYNYSNLPTGCTGSNVSELYCTPSEIGNYSVNVTVEDTHGVENNATVSVLVAAAPSLGSYVTNYPVLTAGAQLNITTTIDGGVPPFTYRYTGLPAGCASQDVALLSCRPSGTGNFRVEVTASDAYNYRLFGNVSFRVNPRGSVVSFTASPAMVDVNATTQLNVSFANGTAPFAFAYGNLPVGCATQDVPVLDCTPTNVGSSDVVVSVTDAFGFTAVSNLTLVVNPALEITAFNVSAPAVDEGTTVGFGVATTGGSGALTYSYSGAPPGCALANSVSPSCKPTAPGEYSVTVNVTDQGNGYANATVEVTVLADPTVAFSWSSLTVDIGQLFDVNVSVVGGLGPFTYVYSGLPSSCQSASSAGANFSCAAATATQGEAILVHVTDADGKVARGNATLTVVPGPTISSFSVDPIAPIVGQAMTLTVGIQGGSKVYKFDYTGLPTGCATANSSSLTCTPTATGTFTVQVLAIDSRGLRASGSEVLNISAAPATGGLFGPLGTTGGLVVIVVIIAVVAIAAVLVLRRRAPPSAPTTDEPAPAEDAPVPPGWEAPPGEDAEA